MTEDEFDRLFAAGEPAEIVRPPVRNLLVRGGETLPMPETFGAPAVVTPGGGGWWWVR